MSWRENLRSQWSVLRESWSNENEASRTRKERTDHEFLPAALEIMEKPPSPGLRWLLLCLCSLFGIALLWACIGTMDVVAVASGKVVPSGNVKVIQPVALGYVRAIHVKNGQHVKEGDLLIELDSTLAGAEQAQAQQGLLTTEVISARNTVLLAHAEGRTVAFIPPLGTSPTVIATQQSYISASIAEYEGERASLGQQRAEQNAILAGAEAEVAKLEQTLPLIERQLEARRELAEKGYFSKLKLLEYEQLQVEHIKNIEIQKANAAKARAAIRNIDAQLVRLRATFGKTAVTELSESQEKTGLAREELAKSSRAFEFQTLRAPVSGTVQQLAVTTIGGVVQPAEPLLIIVPDNAQPVVEAQILNKDIGFIREGQSVRVKLEAFPFTDFGLIEGVVESISRDAVDTSEGQGQQRDENGRPIQAGLVYSARIRLNKSVIRVNGRDQPIGPGLAVQAEIKTGERRIIQYLLSPISQTMDEAGKER